MTQLRLLRSFSGPSGKVVGTTFVLDETRNRFVFPQDRNVIVNFEWEAPAGEHTLTAMWKNPQGRVTYISPDLRLVSEGATMAGYWTYEIYPDTENGIWTIEVRVDGQPSGSHSFEVVVPAQRSTAPAADAPAASPLLSVDQIYQSSLGSMVWVHKLNAEGRRFDTSSGFIVGKDQIATAFQSIDGADFLEVEFQNGRSIKTADVWSLHRLQDWAIVKADTLDLPALPTEAAKESFIGERLIVFSAEPNQRRTIGGVDIIGRDTDPRMGERIRFDPTPTRETLGGPLITQRGKVVAILGGSMTPGSRAEQKPIDLVELAAGLAAPDSSATPISAAFQAIPDPAQPLSAFAAQITPRLQPTTNFLFGGTTLSNPKSSKERTLPLQTRFSRADTVWVYSHWMKREKNGKGAISARVYDAANRLLVEAPINSKANLNSEELRSAFNLQPKDLPRGTYRVDVLWNDQPTWRTYFTIID